jgi:HEPN domain-containing protein
MLEHEKWLAIAYEDLAVAKLVLPQEFFATATYTSQQAAEKALKGYLCYKQQAITKTHDLIKLLELCMQFEMEFKKLYLATRHLNPFATKFRYPTEFDIPDLKEAKLAIHNANLIVQFVIKQLAKPDSGQLQIK